MTYFKPLALAIAMTPLLVSSRVKHGVYAYPGAFEIWERGQRMTTVVLPQSIGTPIPATITENPRILGAHWMAED
jgi:hypothetical protein